MTYLLRSPLTTGHTPVLFYTGNQPVTPWGHMVNQRACPLRLPCQPASLPLEVTWPTSEPVPWGHMVFLLSRAMGQGCIVSLMVTRETEGASWGQRKTWNGSWQRIVSVSLHRVAENLRTDEWLHEIQRQNRAPWKFSRSGGAENSERIKESESLV